MKQNKGITLVALVVTIIILLILAGTSIQALIQTNLFNQAKQAKNTTENAQKEENKTLSEYIDQINEYLPETLAYKVNSGEIPIGSYIKYTPDTASEEIINKLIEELGTYSGSQANTKETLKQEVELNWRVLDVKDGQVRLISDVPTTSKIELKGYNGYNNVVYLLDDVCNRLYSNSKLANKGQNLKVEDITKYVKEIAPKDTNEYKPTNIKYPKILETEKDQTIDITNSTRLDKSEQDKLIIQDTELISITSNLKNQNYSQSIEENNLENIKYYDLFFHNSEKYWLSSRCVNAGYNNAAFCIGYLDSNNLNIYGIYYANNKSYNKAFNFRPVITLKSNVKIDTTKAADGTQPSTAYEIK